MRSGFLLTALARELMDAAKRQAALFKRRIHRQAELQPLPEGLRYLTPQSLDYLGFCLSADLSSKQKALGSRAFLATLVLRISC